VDGTPDEVRSRRRRPTTAGMVWPERCILHVAQDLALEAGDMEADFSRRDFALDTWRAKARRTGGCVETTC
jgi:hypothetical protein